MMFLQQLPVDAISTGNPRVDTWIQLGIVLASAGATAASIIQSRRTPKPSRTRSKRHTPAPVPRSQVQKELDALGGRK